MERRRSSLVVMAIISLLCLVVMAVRMPFPPRSVTDGAEAKSDISSSQILAEMEKLRSQGKRFRPRYYKAGEFAAPNAAAAATAAAKQGIVQRRRSHRRDSSSSPDK